MSVVHAVAWLDHNEAHVIHFGRDDADTQHLHAHGGRAHRQMHNKRAPHERHAIPKEFFDEIAHALDGANEILVCGPGSAKTEFAHYLEEHHRAVRERVFDVQTVDHPSDGELLKHARAYFKAADRMR